MVQSRPASSFNALPGHAVTLGNLHLETDGTLTRGDEVIHLPPKELAALNVLLAHAGNIVTHRELKQALWGDVHVTDDSVTKCLSSLRELLAPDDYIQTVYKRGYRLTTDVHKSETETASGGAAFGYRAIFGRDECARSSWIVHRRGDDLSSHS